MLLIELLDVASDVEWVIRMARLRDTNLIREAHIDELLLDL